MLTLRIKNTKCEWNNKWNNECNKEMMTYDYVPFADINYHQGRKGEGEKLYIFCFYYYAFQFVSLFE